MKVLNCRQACVDLPSTLPPSSCHPPVPLLLARRWFMVKGPSCSLDSGLLGHFVKASLSKRKKHLRSRVRVIPSFQRFMTRFQQWPFLLWMGSRTTETNQVDKGLSLARLSRGRDGNLWHSMIWCESVLIQIFKLILLISCAQCFVAQWQDGPCNWRAREVDDIDRDEATERHLSKASSSTK